MDIWGVLNERAAPFAFRLERHADRKTSSSAPIRIDGLKDQLSE